MPGSFAPTIIHPSVPAFSSPWRWAITYLLLLLIGVFCYLGFAKKSRIYFALAALLLFSLGVFLGVLFALPR